jgi:hypothetical protein
MELTVRRMEGERIVEPGPRTPHEAHWRRASASPVADIFLKSR